MFTRRTYPKTAFAHKYDNIVVNKQAINQVTTACIAAISHSRGLITTLIFEKSVNYLKFMEWIKHLRSKMPKGPFVIFMDNLGCHHNKEVRQLMSQNQITPIYNAAYCHEMNPIELVFNKVKQEFKSKKLNLLMNNQEINTEALI